MTETPIIEIDKLKKHFAIGSGGFFRRRAVQTLHAVDDVSLAIQPGEALGLVGESGCGKSTLSRVLSRLVDPTGGRIKINGQDVTDLNTAAFTRSPMRRHDPDGVSGPDREPEPALHRLRPDRRSVAATGPAGKPGGTEGQGRGGRQCRQPAAGTVEPLPASAVRRPEGPGRHCARHGGRAHGCWCWTSRRRRSTFRCRQRYCNCWTGCGASPGWRCCSSAMTSTW